MDSLLNVLDVVDANAFLRQIDCENAVQLVGGRFRHAVVSQRWKLKFGPNNKRKTYNFRSFLEIIFTE